MFMVLLVLLSSCGGELSQPRKKEPRRTRTKSTSRKAKGQTNKAKIEALSEENTKLKTEIAEMKHKYKRVANRLHTSFRYKNVAEDILNRMLLEYAKSKSINSEYLSQSFKDLHDVEYTKDQILEELETILINEIDYLSRSLEFDTDAIIKGDTTDYLILKRS